MNPLHNKHLHSAKQAQKAVSKKSSAKDKFMPNLKQLREVAEQLPDPETYVPKTFACRLVSNDTVHSIEFCKQEIQRGSQLVARWIYEGKLLIRNRDHQTKS
ncbi:MAG: hypothetical protein CNE95_07190 [Puniceicoccaceae bacterium MED-G30]|jgi:hypothetical protein|nr:MAG: hypothetical protein CNE95_07190 [Puniceicoccaceae bacterium MED-G30]|tara:strand:+ start:398 stop:703 length:306 start_codon:yes stop_codon:yes gene_type:complete